MSKLLNFAGAPKGFFLVIFGRVLCPSVGRSVGLLVGPSVGRLVGQGLVIPL